jgi:hypothetical protein
MERSEAAVATIQSHPEENACSPIVSDLSLEIAQLKEI